MVPTILSEDLHRRIKGSDLIIYPTPATAESSNITRSSPRLLPHSSPTDCL